MVKKEHCDKHYRFVATCPDWNAKLIGVLAIVWLAGSLKTPSQSEDLSGVHEEEIGNVNFHSRRISKITARGRGFWGGKKFLIWIIFRFKLQT